MSAPAAVEVRGLTKRFGAVRALDGLDLTVPAGAVAGFLGPNGAGKSTTLRVLLGLVRADGGTVRLLGGDPWADAVALHRRLAAVPGDVTLWPNLTGGEVLDLLARTRGHLDPRRREELLQRFRLDPTRKARTYSRGNRQKVALVAAFAADVDLLLLDEPTSGLDPLMEAEFAACVAAARERGCSVLLSSHLLGEVEQLCDTVTVVRDGRTVDTGTLAELRHLSGTAVSATTDADPAALQRLPGVSGFGVTRRDGRFALTLTAADAHLGALVAALAPLGVSGLECGRPSLEDAFLRYYGDGDGRAPQEVP